MPDDHTVRPHELIHTKFSLVRVASAELMHQGPASPAPRPSWLTFPDLSGVLGKGTPPLGVASQVWQPPVCGRPEGAGKRSPGRPQEARPLSVLRASPAEPASQVPPQDTHSPSWP